GGGHVSVGRHRQDVGIGGELGDFLFVQLRTQRGNEPVVRGATSALRKTFPYAVLRIRPDPDDYRLRRPRRGLLEQSVYLALLVRGGGRRRGDHDPQRQRSSPDSLTSECSHSSSGVPQSLKQGQIRRA